MTKTIIEDMARKLCLWDRLEPDAESYNRDEGSMEVNWTRYISKAQAALDTLTSKYVLVPKDETVVLDEGELPEVGDVISYWQTKEPDYFSQSTAQRTREIIKRVTKKTLFNIKHQTGISKLKILARNKPVIIRKEGE